MINNLEGIKMKKQLLLSVLFSISSLISAPFIYITNGEGGTVTVVDTATNELIETITVGGITSGIVVNPIGTRVYFTEIDNNLVYVVDTATNTIITSIPVGLTPEEIAITHDGRTVYTTDLNSNTITPIDTATNTAGVPIAGFDQPVSIAITPDDRTAYVVNGGNDTVTPVDLATGTLGVPIPVSQFPNTIAISPNGQTAYVVTSSGALDVIDLTTNTVIDTVVLGGFLEYVVVSFDNRRIYVSDSTNNLLFVLAAGTNSVITALSVSGASGLAFHPCGNILYIADEEISLTPLFVADNTLGTPFAAGVGPYRLAVTPINRVYGQLIKNTFLNKIELALRIKWGVFPITNAAFFRIFQNGAIVGQVFAGSPSEFVVCLSPNFVCNSCSSGCSSSSDRSFNVELGLFAASGVEIARIPVV